MPIALCGEPAQHHAHAGDVEKLGVVVFPTSCSPLVQKEFERGVALLHSFAYEDAIAAFTDAEKKDATCAMAYWGEAMSYWHQIWGDLPDRTHLEKGLSASQKATAIGARTPGERDYVAAISAFYKDWAHLSHATRTLKYRSAMERMHADYPEDREASVFYALSLIATASTHDPTFADRRKAGAILEKVFAEQPEHPGVAHYIIHVYDNSVLASRALIAARRYAQIAPSSVHALHMPSHIFIQVGSWQEAIDSNLASIAAAREYSAKNHLKGVWDMEAHAQDYLAYAYLQLGHDKDAKRVLDEISTAHDKRFGESPGASYSAFAGIPARYAIERKQWAEACALQDHHVPNALYEAETYFARAVGCARSQELEAARASLDHLGALLKNYALADNPHADSNFIKTQKYVGSAWLAFAEKKNTDALGLMQSAVDLEKSTLATWVVAPVLPAQEQLGDLFLELNQPQEALAAFEASMVSTPNRFNGLYGAAQAAERMGDATKAKNYYARLVENCKDGGSDRPELMSAKTFLQEHNASAAKATHLL
jgi:tetratricopeptide (TPR) repeat protein